FQKKADGQLQRLAKKQTTKAQPADQAVLTIRSLFPFRWLTLGNGMVLSTLLVLFYLGHTTVDTLTSGFKTWSGYPQGSVATLIAGELGPWQVSLDCDYPCSINEGTKLAARFNDRSFPNYDSLQLQFTTRAGAKWAVPFRGGAREARLTLDTTLADSELYTLTLRAKDRSGKSYSLEVPFVTLVKVQEQMAERFSSPPQKDYANVPMRVYYVALAFAIVLFLIIGFWTYLVVKAAAKMRRIKVLASYK
ncbi:MAG: hypothetical protein AAF840_15490, partial [Bacteroidota bacterium]